MSRSPVLVTGATGNVGTSVVDHLVAAGVPVWSSTPDSPDTPEPPDTRRGVNKPLSEIRLERSARHHWSDGFETSVSEIVYAPETLAPGGAFAASEADLLNVETDQTLRWDERQKFGIPETDVCALEEREARSEDALR